MTTRASVRGLFERLNIAGVDQGGFAGWDHQPPPGRAWSPTAVGRTGPRTRLSRSRSFATPSASTEASETIETDELNVHNATAGGKSESIKCDSQDMIKRKLSTSGELASELGVTPRTVARWVQRGWITPAVITAGGHFRFDIEDVRRQLDELRKRAK